MALLGFKQSRKLLNFILSWGWGREKLANNLSWLISPSESDDSKKAQQLREYLAGYQVDSLTRKPTPFFNRTPFTDMLQLGVAFDRFLEACHEAKVEPFALEAYVPGLNRGTIGKWCGGLEYPWAPIRENLNKLLQQKAGLAHPINLFRKTSDNELIRSGYLVDVRPQIERNSHGGDRHFGNDPKLRVTNLGASWPMYRYLEKEVLVGYWGEPVYYVKIPDTKKYISKSAHFGERRWQMLCEVKRHSAYAERFTHSREQGVANLWAGL